MMMIIMYYIDGWIEDEVKTIYEKYSLFSMITGKNTMLTQQRPSPIHVIPARRLHHHPSPSILTSKTPPQKKRPAHKTQKPKEPPFLPPFPPYPQKAEKKGRRRPKKENNQSTHPAAATTTAPPTAAASPSARGPISPATH